jgi:hypothetical protein
MQRLNFQFYAKYYEDFVKFAKQTERLINDLVIEGIRQYTENSNKNQLKTIYK